MTTTYRIKAHDYHTDMGGQVECKDPQTCTTASHWSWSSEYDTLREARAHMTDEPAHKIFKVQLVEKITEV